MTDIIAGHNDGSDVPADDLPEIEPTAADLDLVQFEELYRLDLLQERLDAELVELARFGARDEVAARRHRRAVRARLAQVTTATAREVISA